MKWVGFLMAMIVPIALVQGQSKPSKQSITEALGDTLLHQEDFEGALKQYNKVAKSSKLKDKEARQILYKRSLCYFYLGNFEKGLSDLNIFIPENENFIRARILRAFIYRELGNEEQQLNDLNEILKGDQFNIDLLKWRAGLLVQMGKNREAVSELTNIKAFGTDEEVELYLGLSYYGLDEPDSAITHFDEAIAINGGFLPAYQYAGSLAIEQGANELALSYINLALMLEPDNIQLVFYKGIALVQVDKKDEGCRMLTKAFNNGIDDAGDYLKEFCYQSEN